MRKIIFLFIFINISCCPLTYAVPYNTEFLADEFIIETTTTFTETFSSPINFTNGNWEFEGSTWIDDLTTSNNLSLKISDAITQFDATEIIGHWRGEYFTSTSTGSGTNGNVEMDFLRPDLPFTGYEMMILGINYSGSQKDEVSIVIGATLPMFNNPNDYFIALADEESGLDIVDSVFFSDWGLVGTKIGLRLTVTIGNGKVIGSYNLDIENTTVWTQFAKTADIYSYYDVTQSQYYTHFAVNFNPEPSSFILLLIGFLCFFAWKRKK